MSRARGGRALSAGGGGIQTELPRHAAQPTWAEELQCNRSAGERVGGGGEEERSPKHDKIRTNDSPHKPEMLVVFGQSTASQLKSSSSPQGTSSSSTSTRPAEDGLLTS